MSAPTVTFDGLTRTMPERVVRIGWGLLAAGLAVVLAGYAVDPVRSAFIHDIYFLYLTTIAFGATFLVALEYIAGAVWSVPMRRVSEYLSMLVPVAALVGVLLFFRIHDLFHWSHAEAVEADPLLQAKAPYLNTTFFAVRFAVFFTLVALFAFMFRRNSVAQDTTKDPTLTTRNVRLAAIFIPIFAIALTFTGIDWGMSLEPHWFSTIYGVYMFAGTAVTILALVTIIVLFFMEHRILPQLSGDHLYSLGALMFAFLNFWAYIAFSQFMLIWYANLPEETFWFTTRWTGGWEYWSVGLIVLQFAVPYLVLLPQNAKSDPVRLKFIAVWLLVAHLADMYWLVLPTYTKTVSFSWLDLGYAAAFVGLIIVTLAFWVKRGNTVPIGDPKLERAMNFHL